MKMHEILLDQKSLCYEQETVLLVLVSKKEHLFN